VVCDKCPIQPGGLVNQFGCDTFTKQCTCNRPVRDRTSCVTNFECQFNSDESTSTCSLVNDFTLGNSYGSLECNQCPSRPTCHITNGMLAVGRCSCFQQETPVQACSPNDINRRVMPNAAGMCLVTLDQGASRSTNAFYDWNTLATVPCVLLNPSNTYCYNVGQFGYLVVGHGVSSTAFIGDSGSRRRLLSVDVGGNWTLANATSPPPRKEEDKRTDKEKLTNQIFDGLAEFPHSWEHVQSATCRMLVQDYRAMLSRAVDCKCTGMSVSDLNSLYHGCIEWRSTGRSVQYLLPFMQNMDSQTIGAFAGMPREGEPQHAEPHRRDFDSGEAVRGLVPPVERPEGAPPVGKKSQRRLLQAGEGPIERDPISDYSALTASIPGFADIPISNTVADSWLEGPENLCTAGEIMLEVATDTGRVLSSYYHDEFPKRNSNPISWSLSANRIRFYNGTPSVNETENFPVPDRLPRISGGDWVRAFFQFFVDNVLTGILGIRPRDIQAFFVSGKGVSRDELTLGNIVKELLVCDLETVVLGMCWVG